MRAAAGATKLSSGLLASAECIGVNIVGERQSGDIAGLMDEAMHQIIAGPIGSHPEREIKCQCNAMAYIKRTVADQADGLVRKQVAIAVKAALPLFKCIAPDQMAAQQCSNVIYRGRFPD